MRAGRDRLKRVVNDRPTTLERAYQIARSGECSNLEDLVRQLKSERFDAVDAHTSGPSVRRDLRQICQQARRHDPNRPR